MSAFRRWTLPEAGSVDNLVLTATPRPPLGPRQVRVGVRACSLNYRDLSVARGAYGRGGTRANLVPLSDGAGEVLEIGSEVTRFRPGARVGGIFMQRWIAGPITPQAAASALGGAIDGMLAEEVVLDEEGLVTIPDHLSDAEAACLPCAGVTAWHALVGHACLKPGETVLVQGSGGVSVFALQFARMMGARVIATSSSDAKLARLRSMGAETTINYRATPDWQDAVLAATEGQGVDTVVEVGGAGTLARSIQSVRLGGSIALIGVLTAGATIDPTPIMRRSIRLGGIYVGPRTMFEAMNAAIAANQLRPLIDATFPFGRAPDAYRHLIAAQHMGKVVITNP
ncbi:MAG: NAD(P)-dependent alcohol dehydrogenase [Rhodospirillales bacterium]|nr:NAD(P)-dependent alcohol dehydrogenase [Rhodospirillales bacterium]